MKDYTWVKKAVLLGLAFFVAVFLVKPIGVSTQFSMVSGLIHSKIDSQVIQENPEKPGSYVSENAYYAKSNGKLIKAMQNPINYNFVFVLAIPVGAYIAHARRKREAEPVIEKEISSTKLFISGFVGGFILLFGARMAGGCTSGHMMSGITQGSVSGLAFAAAVFATAIPTAILLKKRYGGK